MQKSDQVSLYFLSDLENFRVLLSYQNIIGLKN